jgi:hypothetical protein
MKIRPVGAELFGADDGRTDEHVKLIVASRNFANARKKEYTLKVTARLWATGNTEATRIHINYNHLHEASLSGFNTF